MGKNRTLISLLASVFVLITGAAHAEWIVSKSVSTQRGTCLIESTKFTLTSRADPAEAYLIVSQKSVTLRTNIKVELLNTSIQVDDGEIVKPDKVSLLKFFIFESSVNELINKMKVGKKLQVQINSQTGEVYRANVSLNGFAEAYSDRERCQAEPIK